jgi:hypothetical protein
MLRLKPYARYALLAFGTAIGTMALGNGRLEAQPISNCSGGQNITITNGDSIFANNINCGTITVPVSEIGEFISLDGGNISGIIINGSVQYDTNITIYPSENAVNIQRLTVGNISNFNSITSNASGIRIFDSTVELIINYENSLIDASAGASSAILNEGASTIIEIRNFGILRGHQSSSDIYNFGSFFFPTSAVIRNFHNAQGSLYGAVTLYGNLPENYFIIIRSAQDYGRLSLLNNSPNATVMRFGVSQYSSGLAAGTYTAVLSNITSAEIDATTRSGTIDRFAWTLEDPDRDNSWDLNLRWLGSDPTNTLAALQLNSGAVRSVLSQRAAATTFALDYDCSVFDQHGLCVSVGFRNTQMGNNYADSGETAGLLAAAYRVTPEFRIGGFIDQNLVSNSPTGVSPKGTQPMLGAFAVYQENPNFSGLMIRAALAYQEGDLHITRPEIADTEPGTGRARTSAFAFGGEIAYGFPLDGTWVAQPYAGVRRSDSQRQGYVETTSADVQFSLTYNRFGQQVTSGTAGLRLRGAITPEFSLTFGAGMEYDLDSKMDRYSGTSTISGLETFSIPASQQQNELRAVGSAGMRYMVASNQAVAFDASVRQMPYGNDPSITTMLRYSIGF